MQRTCFDVLSVNLLERRVADVITWSTTQAACKLQWAVATLLMTRWDDFGCMLSLAA